MENFVYYNNLFDIYKELLTVKQREIFSLYYEENLSMQEIADDLSVSKSFVGKVIKDSQTKLEDFEKNFNLYSYKLKLQDLENEEDINKIRKVINEIINNI